MSLAIRAPALAYLSAVFATASPASGAGDPVLVDDFTGGFRPDLWSVETIGDSTIEVSAANDRLELPSSASNGAYRATALVGSGFSLSLDTDFQLRIDWKAVFGQPSAGDAGASLVLVTDLGGDEFSIIDGASVSYGASDFAFYAGYERIVDGRVVKQQFIGRPVGNNFVRARYTAATDVLEFQDPDVGSWSVPDFQSLVGADTVRVALVGYAVATVPAIAGSDRHFDSFRVATGEVHFDPPACIADIDESGVVDFLDLLTVLADFGPCDACPADLDGDGLVGFEDILTVVSNFGRCPE